MRTTQSTYAYTYTHTYPSVWWISRPHPLGKLFRLRTSEPCALKFVYPRGICRESFRRTLLTISGPGTFKSMSQKISSIGHVSSFYPVWLSPTGVSLTVTGIIYQIHSIVMRFIVPKGPRINKPSRRLIEIFVKFFLQTKRKRRKTFQSNWVSKWSMTHPQIQRKFNQVIGTETMDNDNFIEFSYHHWRINILSNWILSPAEHDTWINGIISIS